MLLAAALSDSDELAKDLGLPGLDLDEILDKETGAFKEDAIQSIIDNLRALLPSVSSELPSIADVEELGVFGVKSVSAFASLSSSLNAVVPFSYVNGLMTTMQSLCFAGGEPSDLVFTLDNNDYVLISSSIFNNSGFSDAIVIIKSLVGFIILYAWLKWARNFLFDMI